MWWKSLAKTNDSDFFLLNWPLYWPSTMHTMIKYHRTEQQSYAIMVAHHMHYDNPPLYHTHYGSTWVWYLFTTNPSKSANTASQCYNGVIIFATQSFRISVDSKKKRFVKWLNRELWLSTLYGNFMIWVKHKYTNLTKKLVIDLFSDTYSHYLIS